MSSIMLQNRRFYSKANNNKYRLYFLDNLKVYLTVLVILHHIAIVFGGEGGFVIKVPTNNIVLSLALTLFLALNQSYFMGIFFAISGYFSHVVLANKPKAAFIKGKLTRLILPGLLYFFIINPIIRAFINVAYLGVKPTFKIGFEALWFVMLLGTFDIIYALFIHGKSNVVLVKYPSKLSRLLMSLVVVGIITWAVRIYYPVGKGYLGFQPGHFPQYIFAYLLGVNCAQNNCIRYINNISLKKAIASIVFLVIIFFVGVGLTVAIVNDIAPAFGGANIISLLYANWEQMMFISFLSSLVKIFKMKFNHNGPISKFLTRHAYLVYIVHSFAIVMSVIILSQFKLSLEIMITLTVLLSMLGSILLAKLLKPILKL